MRRVGDGITFSPIKSFKTLPAPGDNLETKIAITADIGALRYWHPIRRLHGLESRQTRHLPSIRAENAGQQRLLPGVLDFILRSHLTSILMAPCRHDTLYVPGADELHGGQQAGRRLPGRRPHVRTAKVRV